MVAAVEQMAFSMERGVPWHELGTMRPGLMTAKEALLESGLAHVVQLVPVEGTPKQVEKPIWSENDQNLQPEIVMLDNDQTVRMPGAFIMLRTSDMKPLSIVGSKYARYQPWMAFQLMEQLIDQSGAKYDTAGSLDEGRKFWISAELPEPMLIGGVDKIRKFMVIASSHDGSLQLTAFRTNVRVVCKNTLNLAMQETPQMWKIRHSGDMTVKVEDVRQATELSLRYDDEFEKEMNQLIEVEFKRGDMEQLVSKLVPSKERGDGGDQARMAMMGLFETSQTIDDAWRYSKYGALQTVAEFRDWIRPRRGGHDADRMVSSLWFGDDQKMKNQALALLRSN